MKLIKNIYSTLTTRDKQIADTILSRKIPVSEMTISYLADQTDVSISTISKFVKKAGFDSFSNFKLQYAREYDVSIIDERISNSDSMEEIGYKLYENVSQSLESTLQLIDFNMLEEIINLMRDARHIYLFGVGASGIACQDLYFKLSRIGKSVLYHSDPHIQLSSLGTASSKDLVIGISYSGKTNEVQIALSQAHKAYIPTVSISGLSNNQLKKSSTYELKIPRHESNFRSAAITSRNDSLFIVDLLYLGYIHEDYEKFVNSLKESQRLTSQLKK